MGCHLSYEESHLVAFLQRGLDFHSTAFFIEVCGWIQRHGVDISQTAWDELLTQCVNLQMPLAACACLCQMAQPVPPNCIVHILNSLADIESFDAIASHVIQRFLLRFTDKVHRWPLEKVTAVILRLSPELFSENLWHVVDRILTLNPPTRFIIELLRKALRNKHFSYDWRVEKSLGLVAQLESIAHVPHEYLDELLNAASECSTQMYSLICSSIFFETLSSVQHVKYLELISTCNDSLVVFLADRFGDSRFGLGSDDNSGVDPSTTRCLAFHRVLECYFESATPVSSPPCMQQAIGLAHKSLAKQMSQTTDGSRSIAVFPLVSMCRTFTLLEWPIDHKTLLDMLVNTFQAATKRSDGVVKFTVEALKIGPASIEAAREAIDRVIASSIASMTSAESPKMTENFCEDNTKNMSNSTVLMFDFSALQSVSDPEMASKFVAFMCANSTAQNMRAVTPFPVIVELLSRSDQSSSLTVIRDFILHCTIKYDWMLISSAGDVLKAVLEAPTISCAVDGTRAQAMGSTNILIALFQAHLQLRCRRVITVVHSVWKEFVFSTFGVKPLLQLPALLERGKPSAERRGY